MLVIGMSSGLVTLTVLLVAQEPRRWLLTRLLPRLLPVRLHAALLRWNEQFATLSLNPALVLQVGAATLLSAAFTFYRLWLLFIALDVVLPLYVIIGSSALIAVLQVLPISIGGIGVRDAVLIAIMTAAPYHYSPEQAIGVSTLFLLITLEHILIGFIISFWFPLSRNSPDTQPDEANHMQDPI